MWAQSLRLAAGLKSESELGCGDSVTGTGPFRHCSNERARAQTFTFGERVSTQASARAERARAGRTETERDGKREERRASERA